MRLFAASKCLNLVLIPYLLALTIAFPTSIDSTTGAELPQLSTNNPPSTSSSSSSSYVQSWQINLGSGWVFTLTDKPIFFSPAEEAAVALDYLFANAAKTASESVPSAAAVFRVGDFGLIIQGVAPDDSTSLSDGVLSWPAVVSFCKTMRQELERGFVVKFDGLITSESGQQMTARLGLLSDLVR